MHNSVMAWIAANVEGLAPPTLEVGSYIVNGTVRDLFGGGYVGVDHASGPGVDVVADALTLPFPARTFRTVVSTEMLEHCERPWVALAEMARVLDGTLLLTARGFDEQRGSFGYHNPPDLWRFGGAEGEAIRAVVTDAGLHVDEVVADPQVPGWFVRASTR